MSPNTPRRRARHAACEPTLRIVAAATMAFCAATAHAQDRAAPARDSAQDTAEQATETLDEIEVTGDAASDQRRYSTTARIVVDRKEIERYGDDNLGDLLKRLPGVSIDGTSGRGASVRMRGLGRGYVQILINGEPAPNGFSLDSIAPDLIERIEVLRAPTADTSAQAIAGSINLVLKQSARPSQTEWKLSLANEHGEPALGLSAQIGRGDKALSYMLSANIGHEELVRPTTILERGRDGNAVPTLDRRTERVVDSSGDNISILGNVKRALADDGSLGVDGMYSLRRIDGTSLDQVETFLGPFPDLSAVDVDFRSSTELYQAKVKWLHRPSDYARLDVDLGLRASRRDTDVESDGFDETGARALLRTVKGRSRDLDTTFSGKYSTPLGEGHALAAGWQGERNRREDRRIQDDTPFDGRLPIDLDESYTAEIARLAFYVQDEWTLRKRWSAYLGLRWEAMDTRTRGNGIVGARNRVQLLSPILQSTWGVPGIETDQVRFGLSRTYKAPLAVELIPRRVIANNNTPNSPDTEGNPQLRPERAWGLDLAYERTWNKNGLLAASVYARRIDDVILQDLANVGGLWISRPVNMGGADVYGIGLEAKFDLRWLHARLPSVDVRMNLDRNWSSVDEVPGPRNTLDRQQPTTFNLSLDYRVPTAPLSFGGNFGYSGSKSARISQTQIAALGFRRTLDLYAAWKPTERLNLRLSVANLLRRDTDADAVFLGGSGVLEQTTITPMRTTVRLIAEYKF